MGGHDEEKVQQVQKDQVQEVFLDDLDLSEEYGWGPSAAEIDSTNYNRIIEDSRDIVEFEIDGVMESFNRIALTECYENYKKYGSIFDDKIMKAIQKIKGN